MKKTTAEFWQAWWDDCAKKSDSDFVLNRCSTIRLNEREEHARQQFLHDVDPQPTDVVLDAGCGSGRNLSILSSRVREIVGIDYSPAMLARAEERLQIEKLINVSLVEGSVSKLDFPDNFFDKVVCASVLQYLDRPQCEHALKELVRVCKPQGILVLHIKNGTSLYALSLKLVRAICRLFGRQPKPEQYRSRKWYASVLSKLGGNLEHYDSFGIFTFVPMPNRLLTQVSKFEMCHLADNRSLKRFGVNLQMKIRIQKEFT